MTPKSSDMTCEAIMYADEEHQVYTLDYTFHSDVLMYHSETTIIFQTSHACCVYLAALRKKCMVGHISFSEKIEVI